METHKVIIIGSGPAGHTAALYAARADLKPLVIEGHEPGGQLTTTTDVENFPGFPEGIMGPELMVNFKKQAKRFGAEYLGTLVTKVDFSKRPFHITCENGKEFFAETAIISTGASAKYLGLPNEMSLIGKGVSGCATCDGFFFRNQIVHVVGGGDTAIEEATFLTKFASKVYMVHRRDEFRASKAMQARAFANEKIEIIWDTEVVEIIADDNGVNAIKVKNNKTGEVTERKTDGLFMGIGHTPNTKFLEGQINLDDHGFIKTAGKHPDTNVEGVFACGDVQDSYYRQAISAAGSGCEAAIRAERFLSEG
ncbi:MAG: thioredoxin-disulfide reductase [Bdellovibrionales bacterium CG12_big_fil_rev_8_21_14_0_65_38_15]|nr:MAG: thioredoxin-disulfide reductase [Bdellovibrionales bacterium CG22_combo_CG10-13_8_21_14_all_38_13]PIQ55292.1 MAG: thioredoxin-disulfide reductase [Bdellovibrionales bacterium CG12_big_fil_rev_8_21_14_0_65_38_15]PIR30796.1 MAG: thioredoxin-disulfide reductase [Bdellovibrionales bacterium CG11_big_fil_rev_8_21_14_0_20_38_13]